MASYPAQSPDESAQAYQAAVAYFEMGADRSMESVAQRLSKSSQLMKRWSAQHDWVDRARSYDAALSEEAAAQHTKKYLANLAAHQKRAIDAAKGIYTVAGLLLKRMHEQIDTLELTPTTLGVLLKAFQTSLDIEAHALGIDRVEGDDSE